jgi:uncharacterized protein YjiS (DUF1127 family)
MTTKIEATLDPFTTKSGAPDVFARVARFLNDRLIEPVVRWRRCAAMTRQLEALDDRILDDIGISRYQIPDVVAQAYAAQSNGRSAPAAASVHRLPVNHSDGRTARVDILRSKAA